MKTLTFRIIAPVLSVLVIIASCGQGKGEEARITAGKKRAAELAEIQAKWEHYVAGVDSLVRTDHSARAYLSLAWICFNEEDHARALRHTDTVLALAVDSTPPEVIDNARYLRSLCFDQLGQTEKSIEEMKLVVASEEREGPDMCHESKLNLAHYYLKRKRFDEALATLPDSTSPGGKHLWQEIHKKH